MKSSNHMKVTVLKKAKYETLVLNEYRYSDFSKLRLLINIYTKIKRNREHNY